MKQREEEGSELQPRHEYTLVWVRCGGTSFLIGVLVARCAALCPTAAATAASTLRGAGKGLGAGHLRAQQQATRGPAVAACGSPNCRGSPKHAHAWASADGVLLLATSSRCGCGGVSGGKRQANGCRQLLSRRGERGRHGRRDNETTSWHHYHDLLRGASLQPYLCGSRGSKGETRRWRAWQPASTLVTWRRVVSRLCMCVGRYCRGCVSWRRWGVLLGAARSGTHVGATQGTRGRGRSRRV